MILGFGWNSHLLSVSASSMFVDLVMRKGRNFGGKSYLN